MNTYRTSADIRVRLLLHGEAFAIWQDRHRERPPRNSEKTISHQRRSMKIASMAKRLLTAHGGFDEAVVASRKKLATRRRISRQAEEPCSTLLRFNAQLDIMRLCGFERITMVAYAGKYLVKLA